MEIKPGSIVLVEFRKNKIFGYVAYIKTLAEKRILIKEAKLNLKPILSILNDDPIVSLKELSFANWLKNYANLSLASSLKLFFPYTKKLISLRKKEILSNIKEIKNKINKKILIVIPDESYIDFVTEKVQNKYHITPLIVSSKLTEKKFFELIEKVLSPEKNIFISVKNGIFLPWQFLDELIVYDEGSIFYKEYFKKPYFNYRKIFLKFAEINKIKYTALTKFPSLDYILKSKEKFNIRINFSKIGSLEEFENIIKNYKKTVIFVPKKTNDKLICSECFFVLNCELCGRELIFNQELICPYCFKKYKIPNICPQCLKNSEFILKNFTVSSFYKYLLKIGRKPIAYVKESKKIIDVFNVKEEADLIGSLLILNPNIKHIDAFFFLNFDNFYFSYDPFIREKYLRILHFFYQRTKNIFIFTNITNPLIENYIVNGKIVNLLLEERKINELPPYKRLIILKTGLKNLQILQKRMENIRKQILEKNQNLKINGPIFASPFKIKNRYFLELIIKVENDLDINLKKILKNINIEEIDIDAEKT